MDTTLNDFIAIDELFELTTSGLQITSATSFLTASEIDDNHFKMLRAGRNKKEVTSDFPQINEVVFPPVGNNEMQSHALLRWNMRVGPITDTSALSNLMSYVIHYEPERIHKANNHFAYLDNDICFYYTIEESVMKIHTFYGRSNLRPSINDVVRMKIYNSLQDDRVDLQLTPSEIQNQQFPLMPNTLFKYRNRAGELFELQYFKKKNRKMDGFIFLSKRVNDKSKNILSLPLQNIAGASISYETLRLLYMAGFKKQVYSNLLQKQSLMNDLSEFYKKPAIRTFKFWLKKRLGN